MAGIPGLRDMWGALGDTLDWVGETAEEALAFIASPFVDEEGELFGFISRDDLENAYQKRQKNKSSSGYTAPSGTKGYIDVAAANVLAESQKISVAPGTAQRAITEPYPNYNVQATGMQDFTKNIEDILNSTKSQVETTRESITKGKNINIQNSPSFIQMPEPIDLPDIIKGD